MKLLGSGIDAATAVENDIFGRDKFSEGLLHLFSLSGDPLVISLDEKWGTGKTVFAKRFVRQAEAAGHTAVYFDAFKRDYDPDVFISLTAELLAKFPDDPIQKKSIREKAAAVGKVISRVGLKIGFRALTGGIGKISDIEEANEEVDSGDSDSVYSILNTEFDKLVDERLGSAKAADLAFQSFRQALQDLGQSGGRNARPLIFIVDELDRCRPDYALDVLETVKHFFSVPGVHFFLVCDMGQLKASVATRYGTSIDSEAYLEKFIDARVTFPVLNKSSRQKALSSFIMSTILGMPDDGEKGQQWRGIQEFLYNVSIERSYSLRRIEKILTQFALCMAFTKTNELRINVLICLLCDLKISERELFRRAKMGKLKYSELDKIYNFENGSLKYDILLFRYFYDDNIDLTTNEWQDFRRSSFASRINDPKETAKYYANEIVDRISL